MPDRSTQLRWFVTVAGWGDASVVSVAGDASNRRYDRLTHPDGGTAILMDAPPDRGENVRPFVTIARFLNRVGLSAPQVLAQDALHGFLLLEDLGDDLFARVLARNPEMSFELYAAAIDVLVRLHGVTPPDLDPYDAPRMAELAALVVDWYAPGLGRDCPAATREKMVGCVRDLLAPLDQQPRILIQRDYHAENLVWLPQRKGHARVGLLDFQDAMLGHPAYDLVSILQDARRDVPGDTEQAMTERYVAATGTDEQAFRTAYALLGAQRAMRILGVFARLCLRDGKAHYVDLIPRVWGQLQQNLAHPALSQLRDMVDSTLPAPDPDALSRLKSNCAARA